MPIWEDKIESLRREDELEEEVLKSFQQSFSTTFIFLLREEYNFNIFKSTQLLTFQFYLDNLYGKLFLLNFFKNRPSKQNSKPPIYVCYDFVLTYT